MMGRIMNGNRIERETGSEASKSLAAGSGEWKRAIMRGLGCRCPACGEGRAFSSYLKVSPACDACGQELHHHRADDLPPYLTIFVVGKIVGTGIYISEMHYEPALWFHMGTWPLLTVALSLALLQPMKGAVVGLQYALGMHGFGDADPAGRDGDNERGNTA